MESEKKDAAKPEKRNKMRVIKVGLKLGVMPKAYKSRETTNTAAAATRHLGMGSPVHIKIEVK
jgi:hypothetical protein